MRPAVLVLMIVLPVAMDAATFYVDFAGGADTNSGVAKASPWKHIPGMAGCTGGCASTVLAGGDTVIFKGGTTWTGSFPWDVQGGQSSAVTYTTDHSWFSGSAYSQPVFNGQKADMAGGMITSSASYMVINDFSVINCGNQPASVSEQQCLVFTNTNNVTISNSTFQTFDWISVYFRFTSPGSYNNFTFTGNDFSHTSNAIWIASAQSNTTVHSVTISGNTFHDYHDNMVGGTHGNGLHYYGVPSSDSTQYLDGMVYCNNRSYGDFTSNGPYTGGNTGGGMTAFFFFESPVSGVVCNNDFSFNPTQNNMFNSLIMLAGNGNAHKMSLGIYNNSLVNVGTSAMSAAINVQSLAAGDSVIIKNNIMSSMQYCMYFQDAQSAAAVTSDYNLLNCSSGENDYVNSLKSYSQWQSLGFDTHSVLGKDPSWVAAPGNEHLNAGSPAIGSGVNLFGLGISALNVDADGIARPGSGAWDMGAFGGGSATGPNPPSGLLLGVR